MAYAAGVPDEDPALFATDGDLCVHPLFPVAPEWESLLSIRAATVGMTTDETRRGIHARHELAWASPLRVGELVTITPTLVGVGRSRAGAQHTVRLDATAEDGALRWSTRYTSLFLGVDLVGEPTSLDEEPGPLPPFGGVVAEAHSEVRPIDAHVYTECARIWNPIHTDAVAARSAGLTAPILHGTATLARALSVSARELGIPVSAITGVGARFVGQVPNGCTLSVQVGDDVGKWTPVSVSVVGGPTALVGAFRR
jgi:acyl dehydratase